MNERTGTVSGRTPHILPPVALPALWWRFAPEMAANPTAVGFGPILDVRSRCSLGSSFGLPRHTNAVLTLVDCHRDDVTMGAKRSKRGCHPEVKG